jgi:release factor glutamine methyltransferase
MSAFETIRDQLAAQLSFLPDKPEENADSTLRALWCVAQGKPRSTQLALHEEITELSPAQVQTLQALVARRISGVPLAHITGRQHFMGMEMLAGPEALVPRHETELLASTAIRLVRETLGSNPAPTVIDVCTGSGNVALAIGHHVLVARVFAADLSEAAVELAARNAAHLGLGERVKFSAGDLLAPFDTPSFLGSVDVLTCNPPYITSGKVERMPSEISAHEPRLAFDGGALGISVLMRLIQEAPRFLRPGGWLAFEVGLGQGPGLVKRLSALPSYKEVITAQDEAGAVRVIAARC